MTTKVEFQFSTISDTGSDAEVIGYRVDRQDQLRAAIGRPFDIYLPTANGPVTAQARITRVDGTTAYATALVDDLGVAHLEDLFAPTDWRAPVMRMFGSAVLDVVVTADLTADAGHVTDDTGTHGHESENK